MSAHFADTATTLYGAGKGVVKELNPLFAPHLDNPLALGLIKGGIATGSNYALLKLQEARPKTTLTLGLAQCVGFSAIAAHNARIIREAQQ